MNAPHTRADDPDGIKIDRTIPLWGVLTAAAIIFGQGLILWNGQNLQAAEIRRLSDVTVEMAKQLKTLADQGNAKDTIDVKQDLRIDELQRRVLLLEEMKGQRR